MPTVKTYAASRGVRRRTVIDWIARGFVVAHRKGYGKTSVWIIDHDRLPPDPTPRTVRRSAAITDDDDGSAGQHIRAEQITQPPPAVDLPIPPAPPVRYVTDPEIDQCDPDELARWIADKRGQRTTNRE